MNNASPSATPIYRNEVWSLFPDRVVEGSREARSVDGLTLHSNHRFDDSGPGGSVTPDPGRNAPAARTGAPLLDCLWRLAHADVNANINERGVLDAGAVYSDYEWVRDTAYSLMLGYDLVAPALAGRCLDNLVDPDLGIVKLEQYSAEWEAWPYRMTDSAIWVTAVRRFAEVTGRPAFARRHYRAAAATLDRFRRDDFDETDGLYIGNSSFFDGHNGYPMGYSGRGLLKTLSNNCIHYAALRDLAAIARHAGRPDREVNRWSMQAALLAEAIREEFARDGIADGELGYPVQIKFGADTWERRFEALGCALYLLFGLADDGEAASILDNAPSTPWGVPSTWPDYVDRVPYHTASVWPFVAGLWGIAAARHARADLLADAIGAVARIGALELTFVELLFDGTGRRMGSDHQLWSACGYLGLLIHGWAGITPCADGFRVQPCVPDGFPAELALQGIRLGPGRVDLTVRGHGARVRDLRVDGAPVEPTAPVPLPSRGATTTIEAVVGPRRRADAPYHVAPPVPDPSVSVELHPASLVVCPGEDQHARFRVIARCSAGAGPGSAVRLSWLSNPRWRTRPEDAEFVLDADHEAVWTVELDPVDVREVITEDLRLVADRAGVETEIRFPVRREFDLMSEWLFIPRDGRGFAAVDLDENDPMPYWDPVHVAPDRWRRLRVPMPIETRIPWIADHSVGWYRRHLHIPRAWRRRDLVLLLGGIGGAHKVFFNGEPIGASRTATPDNATARFLVPSSLVRAGHSNLVAARVRLNTPPRGIHRGPTHIAPA